jgi:hypothetical protein
MLTFWKTYKASAVLDDYVLIQTLYFFGWGIITESGLNLIDKILPTIYFS